MEMELGERITENRLLNLIVLIVHVDEKDLGDVFEMSAVQIGVEVAVEGPNVGVQGRTHGQTNVVGNIVQTFQEIRIGFVQSVVVDRSNRRIVREESLKNVTAVHSSQTIVVVQHSQDSEQQFVHRRCVLLETEGFRLEERPERGDRRGTNGCGGASGFPLHVRQNTSIDQNGQIRAECRCFFVGIVDELEQMGDNQQALIAHLGIPIWLHDDGQQFDDLFEKEAIRRARVHDECFEEKSISATT